MPTPKRERKREGKLARQQAQLEAQRRAARRQRIIRFTIPAAFLVAVLAFIALRGGDDNGGDADNADDAAAPTTTKAAGECGTPEQLQFPTPPNMAIDAAKKYTAAVATNKGNFTIELDPARAPKTVNNFVFLARRDYFDGVVFHRIIPGFVVQGGDPAGTGSGGPGYKFEDELPKAGEYRLGSVAMANSGPNTNGSQFFIITGPQGEQLPPNYSLFGRVTEGMDVVKAIEATGSPSGTPTAPTCMKSVEIAET